MPQFSTLLFDMCLIVQPGGSPRITLLWGHSSEVPPGFNPLMSPTLKRQLASAGGSNSGAAGTARCVCVSVVRQPDLSCHMLAMATGCLATTCV